MKPTLRQVAKQAGVSEATVSRVLNRRPGVAEPTRTVVLQAVELLGYQHGYGHQLHRAAPPETVGVLVPEFDNPIFPAYAQAIERELARRGLTVGVCSSSLEATEERTHVEMLLARGVVGLVFVSGVHADRTADLIHYERLLEQGMPMVFLNGHVDSLAATFLATDHRSAARTAVGHLADLGHRRIGLAVGPERYAPSQRWRDGYQQALTERFGRHGRPSVVEAVYSVEGGHVAGNQLLESGVTAIVTASDLMALGAIRAARIRGVDVPRAVSVIGYDGTPLMQFTDPPLTTLRQPVAALARAAVTLLLQQREAGARAGGEHLFRAELQVRGSTAPPIKSRAASEIR